MVTIQNRLGDYLRELRKSSKMTLDDVQIATKISRTSLVAWEHNKRIPTNRSLQKLAQLYNVDLLDFYRLIKYGGIPVYDRAHISVMKTNLGETKNIIDFLDDDFLPTKNIEDYFATKKEDDSLDKEGFKIGSIVYCRKTNKIKNDEIGIFIVNNEAIMRRISYIDDKEAYLLPESNNPAYDTKRVTISDIEIIAQVEISVTNHRVK